MSRRSRASGGGVTVVTWSPAWGVPPIEAFASSNLARGVAVRFVGLDRQGTPASGPWPVKSPDESVPSRLPGTRLSRNRAMWAELRNFFRRYPEDTYVAFDARALTLLGLAAPRSRRVYYCLDVLPASGIRRAVESWMISRAQFAAVTESAKLAAPGIRTLARRRRASVVRNAIPRATARRLSQLKSERVELRQILHVPPHVKVLIHAGGVGDSFGLAEEIEMLDLLSDEFQLVVLGPPSSTARSDSNDPRVRWTGRVSNLDWNQWLAIADIGLAFWSGQRTATNGQWNTPLSWNRLYWYVAVGLPIVGGGHDAIQGFLLETGAGLNVPSLAPARMAEAVNMVAADESAFSASSARAFDSSLNYDDQVAPLLEAIAT